MVEEQQGNDKEVKSEAELIEAVVPSNIREKHLPQWIDNDNNEVENVFGFNQNAELVNARAAMIGFLMLILTELVFGGKPVTLSIFGIS